MAYGLGRPLSCYSFLLIFGLAPFVTSVIADEPLLETEPLTQPWIKVCSKFLLMVIPGSCLYYALARPEYERVIRWIGRVMPLLMVPNTMWTLWVQKGVYEEETGVGDPWLIFGDTPALLVNSTGAVL